MSREFEPVQETNPIRLIALWANKINMLSEEYLLMLPYFSILSFFDPDFAKVLKDPERRRNLIKYEAKTGLFRRSIMQNPLYVPNEEGYLEGISAKRGEWVAYDFLRRRNFEILPQWFGRISQLYRGALECYFLDEVADNPPHENTPYDLLKIYSSGHASTRDKASIDTLVARGMVEGVDYKTAYERVGLFDRHERQMDLLGITDKDVFQVTPKGNALIFLSRRIIGGKPKKDPVRTYDRILKPT